MRLRPIDPPPQAGSGSGSNAANRLARFAAAGLLDTRCSLCSGNGIGGRSLWLEGVEDFAERWNDSATVLASAIQMLTMPVATFSAVVDSKSGSAYREWVMTYSSAQFEALARRVEGLLDRHGGDHDRLAVLYHQAMELELRFFDAAARCERP
jgi:hypothetical protein